MKLVGYLRVSTAGQVERGLGLPVQEQAVLTWAREHGHKLVEVFADEGVSGTLADREQLAHALHAVRDGRVEGIVVTRLDRLARDLIVQEQLLGEVRRLGGQVFSTSMAEQAFLADDPDDPSRKMIRQVLGAVSEFERAMIRLRLRNGRRAKAERGGFAYGSPPLGYRAEGRELVPDEDEQRAVARIRELHGEGLSLREIAATLDAEGVRPKRAARWSAEAVRRVLNRS